MLKIDSFVFNDFEINTFILSNELKECIIIDPGCYYEREKDELITFILDHKLKPVLLINTHGHIDHVIGNQFIKDTYKIYSQAHKDDDMILDSVKEQALMFGFKLDAVPKTDQYIEEGEDIIFGNHKLSVFHVPGHSPGSIVLYNKEFKFLIAGDVLFRGSIGRTDLPGGNHQQLIRNIHEKLLVLDDDIEVYCGHGPTTTIGNEKNTNPFLI